MVSLGSFWGHFVELWGSLWGALRILGATGPAPHFGLPFVGTLGDSQTCRKTGAQHRQTGRQRQAERQTYRQSGRQVSNVLSVSLLDQVYRLRPCRRRPFFFDWYLVVFVFHKPVAQATEGTFWCCFPVNLVVMRFTLDCCWLFGGLRVTLGPAMGA